MLLYIKTQRPTQDITLITFITILLVPLLGVEPREFFLLRETTLPICPQGQIIWCEWRDSNPQSLRREILSLLCIPFHHSRIWCPRRDSNSQDLVSKTSTYTNSVTWAFGVDCRNRTYFHGSSGHRYDHIS